MSRDRDRIHNLVKLAFSKENVLINNIIHFIVTIGLKSPDKTTHNDAITALTMIGKHAARADSKIRALEAIRALARQHPQASVFALVAIGMVAQSSDKRTLHIIALQGYSEIAANDRENAGYCLEQIAELSNRHPDMRLQQHALKEINATASHHPELGALADQKIREIRHSPEAQETKNPQAPESPQHSRPDFYPALEQWVNDMVPDKIPARTRQPKPPGP